jgi:hypothetical protein
MACRPSFQPSAFSSARSLHHRAQGKWWVGTGTKFDPDGTVPMPAGTFVTHFGQQVHFDGATEEDAVLLIVGEGPGTSTPAEVK